MSTTLGWWRRYRWGEQWWCGDHYAGSHTTLVAPLRSAATTVTRKLTPWVRPLSLASWLLECSHWTWQCAGSRRPARHATLASCSYAGPRACQAGGGEAGPAPLSRKRRVTRLPPTTWSWKGQWTGTPGWLGSWRRGRTWRWAAVTNSHNSTASTAPPSPTVPRHRRPLNMYNSSKLVELGALCL